VINPPPPPSPPLLSPPPTPICVYRCAGIRCYIWPGVVTRSASAPATTCSWAVDPVKGLVVVGGRRSQGVRHANICLSALLGSLFSASKLAALLAAEDVPASVAVVLQGVALVSARNGPVLARVTPGDRSCTHSRAPTHTHALSLSLSLSYTSTCAQSVSHAR